MMNCAYFFPTIIGDYPAPIPILSFPIALRWEVFLFLFSVVVFLELAIMILFLRPKNRSIPLVLLANIVTSCLMVPSFIFNLGWDWDDFPLMLSASFVREASQEKNLMGSVELGGGLLISFVLILFLYGLPTMVIEGAIIRYFAEGSSKKIWSAVVLGNIVSYLFLTLWSGYIGFQLKNMDSEEASDYVFKHILSKPSEGEFEDLKFLGWFFFVMVLLLCISILYFGNRLFRTSSDQIMPIYSIKINNMAFNMGLVYFFVFSLANHQQTLAILLYFILGAVFLTATSSEWADTSLQQKQ